MNANEDAEAEFSEKVLYESHPSMFRNQPVWFVISVLLCLVGVGLVIFAIWFIKCKGTTLTVTEDRTLSLIHI